jgi:hypothetical protein
MAPSTQCCDRCQAHEQELHDDDAAISIATRHCSSTTAFCIAIFTGDGGARAQQWAIPVCLVSSSVSKRLTHAELTPVIAAGERMMERKEKATAAPS